MTSTDDISDKELAELYHDASDESSPASLDQTILAIAREHAQMHQTNVRLRKFTPRFAWAAVVLLSIGVVLSIEFGDYSSTSDYSRSESQPSLKKKFSRPPAKPQAPAKLDSEPLREAESTFSGSSESSATASVDKKIASTDTQPELARSRIAAKKPAAVAPAPPQSSAALSPAPAEPMIIESDSTNKKSADTEFSRQTAKLKAKPQAESPSKACGNLSAYACAESATCVLIKADSGLLCRQATNHCETGFNQLKPSEMLCQEIEGCQFVNGDCQCNKQSGECICNSKGPAICRPQN